MEKTKQKPTVNEIMLEREKNDNIIRKLLKQGKIQQAKMLEKINIELFGDALNATN